jgi:hypothetical protein
LPELRHVTRNEPCNSVKLIHGLRDAALLKIGYGAIQDLLRLFVSALPERSEGEDTNQKRASRDAIASFHKSFANSIGQQRRASNV